jgi:hypothetical protein
MKDGIKFIFGFIILYEQSGVFFQLVLQVVHFLLEAVQLAIRPSLKISAISWNYINFVKSASLFEKGLSNAKFLCRNVDWKMKVLLDFIQGRFSLPARHCNEPMNSIG